ncbi:TIGR03089 family protein [Luedemannella flava]|uniref:TIGR03089 family protein n=1 Tax=Luedemannella flava TaxID=349316 RepID=A0ABN2LQC1_9ACTN
MTDERPAPAVRTVPAALAAAVAADPTRPLLTFYDDATGERTELSGATLSNWISKTANLLIDGCGLSPGDVAAVRLPAHWQTAAVLLGAWAAGLAIDPGSTSGSPATDAGTTAGGTADGRAADVAFVAADRVGGAPTSASDVFVLGLAPMAMPMRPAPPPGTVDYVAEVRGHGDHFAPRAPTNPTAPALGPATHEQVIATAADRASAAGIAPGDRVLIDADALPDPQDWLLTPLVAGATIVLVRHATTDGSVTERRIAAERVTRRLPAG